MSDNTANLLPEFLSLMVTAVYEATNPEWGYFARNIAKNAPPQKIVRLTTESVEKVKQYAPDKILRQRPNCVIVVCRSATIPVGREVIFNLTKNKGHLNIEYINQDDHVETSSLLNPASPPFIAESESTPEHNTDLTAQPLWKELKELLEKKKTLETRIEEILMILDPNKG